MGSVVSLRTGRNTTAGVRERSTSGWLVDLEIVAAFSPARLGRSVD